MILSNNFIRKKKTIISKKKMEAYAVGRLTRIFNEYNCKETNNQLLAETIVNALIKKTKNYNRFKLCFWKLLWNLHIKGTL